MSLKYKLDRCMHYYALGDLLVTRPEKQGERKRRRRGNLCVRARRECTNCIHVVIYDFYLSTLLQSEFRIDIAFMPVFHRTGPQHFTYFNSEYEQIMLPYGIFLPTAPPVGSKKKKKSFVSVFPHWTSV